MTNTTAQAREQARERAGLTLAQAAAKLRVGENYVRRIEKHGRAPYCLALRMARLYKISTNLLL